METQVVATVSLGGAGAYAFYSYFPLTSNQSYIDYFASKYSILASDIAKRFRTIGFGTLADKIADRRVLQHAYLHQYYGEYFGVDPKLTMAIEWQESKGSPLVKRYEPSLKDYSVGVMQTLTKTAASMGGNGTISQLENPESSIRYGVEYISKQQTKYGDQGVEAVISSYNAGRPITSNFVSYVIPVMKKILDYQGVVV